MQTFHPPDIEKAQNSQPLLTYKFPSLNHLGDSPYNCIQLVNVSLPTQHGFFWYDTRSGSILSSSTLKAVWSRPEAALSAVRGLAEDFCSVQESFWVSILILPSEKLVWSFFLFSSCGNLHEQGQWCPTEVPSLSSSSCHLQTWGSCSASTPSPS